MKSLALSNRLSGPFVFCVSFARSSHLLRDPLTCLVGLIHELLTFQIDGATLFYTSNKRFNTFTRLCDYILHRLHDDDEDTRQISENKAVSNTLPLALQKACWEVTGTTTETRLKINFPFDCSVKYQSCRDIMITSGWDSWSKIKACQPGFDCQWLHDTWLTCIRATREVQAGKDDHVAGRLLVPLQFRVPRIDDITSWYAERIMTPAWGEPDAQVSVICDVN